MRKILKIVITPVFEDNPYVRSLAAELSTLGHDVLMSDYIFRTWAAFASTIRSDVLHIQWVEPYFIGRTRFTSAIRFSSLLCVVLFLRLRRKKVVWTVHNLLDHDRVNVGLQLFFSKCLAKVVSRLIVHSSSGVGELIKTYSISKANKVYVVAHPHYLSDYPTTFEGVSIRSQLKLANDRFVFGCIGQMRGYKNPTGVVEDFLSLFSEHNDAALLLAGRIDEETHRHVANLSESYRNKIFLVNERISEQEFVRYFEAVDVFVMTQTDVFTSGAVVLAHTFATPCIGPAIGCVSDQIGPDGYSFDIGTVGARRAAMLTAYTERDQLVEKGHRSYVQASKQGWPEAATETLSIYLR